MNTETLYSFFIAGRKGMSGKPFFINDAVYSLHPEIIRESSSKLFDIVSNNERIQLYGIDGKTPINSECVDLLIRILYYDDIEFDNVSDEIICDVRHICRIYEVNNSIIQEQLEQAFDGVIESFIDNRFGSYIGMIKTQKCKNDYSMLLEQCELTRYKMIRESTKVEIKKRIKMWKKIIESDNTPLWSLWSPSHAHREVKVPKNEKSPVSDVDEKCESTESSNERIIILSDDRVIHDILTNNPRFTRIKKRVVSDENQYSMKLLGNITILYNAEDSTIREVVNYIINNSKHVRLGLLNSRASFPKKLSAKMYKNIIEIKKDEHGFLAELIDFDDEEVESIDDVYIKKLRYRYLSCLD